MVRVRSGDLDAYGELVRRHARTALRTAVLLGAGPAGEDVVQEAFVKAYRSLGTFRDGAPFRPWLLRIVANEAHNLHRSDVRRRARDRTASMLLPPDLVRPDTGDPADRVLQDDQRHRLLAAVRGLPEPLRAVVTCRFLLDLGEAETATVLGLPRGTVKSRTSRALGRLRTMVPKDLVDATDRKETGDG